MKAVMLKNTNLMKNKVIEFVNPKSQNMFFKHICAKDKIIYYLLNSDGNIIGVISLDKIQFTDFQNTANNNKVYSFGIKMADGSSKTHSAFFIFDVWNDFINIKRNFIYCVNLNINFIKGFREDLNKFYNIYYQLNSDTVDVIFGSKVEGKKKYLKIKDGQGYKLTKKNTKNLNQISHINAYLRNHPENNPANS